MPPSWTRPCKTGQTLRKGCFPIGVGRVCEYQEKGEVEPIAAARVKDHCCVRKAKRKKKSPLLSCPAVSPITPPWQSPAGSCCPQVIYRTLAPGSQSQEEMKDLELRHHSVVTLCSFCSFLKGLRLPFLTGL